MRYLVLALLFSGCGTVSYSVQAGEAVQCRIKRSAPFRVECSITTINGDTDTVFEMTGPQELPLECPSE